MSEIELNDDFKLAESYLNTTNEHLFVTEMRVQVKLHF
jgi:hypothetical protein